MQNIDKKELETKLTYLFTRPEINIVYAVSEFIDNFKQIIDDNSEFFLKNKIDPTMNFEINEDEGYLKISDNGTGFDVIENLNFGNDIQKDGRTSEHGVGLKTALNFFGNISIIISERKTEYGSYVREFAYFLWYNNKVYKTAPFIKPKGFCGTEIYLFSRIEDFNNFCSNLEWLNDEKPSDLPINLDMLNLQKDAKDDYKKNHKVDEILQNSKLVNLISPFIYERYSYTAKNYFKKGLNFKINCSQIRRKETFSLTLDENYCLLKNSEFNKRFPFLNWNQSRSFSFKNFRDKIKLIFPNYETIIDEKSPFFEDFKEELELFFINDVEKYHQFNKNKEDFLKSINMINNHGKRFWNIDNGLKKLNIDVKKWGFKNTFWNEPENIWARQTLEPIFIGLIIDSVPNDFIYEIKLEVNKLSLSSDIESDIHTLYPNESEFSLNFNFYFNSQTSYKNKYNSNFSYKFSPKIWSGLRIIKLNRAIYHGPNFDEFKTKIWGDINQKILFSKIHNTYGPKRFLNDYFFNYGMKSDFLNHKNDEIMPFIIGGADFFTLNIFGDCFIPETNVFKTTINKREISNLNSLEKFTKLIIYRLSLMNVSLFLKALDNSLQKTSKSSNIFIIKILEKYNEKINLQKTVQLEKNTENNLNGDLTSINEVYMNSNYKIESTNNLFSNITTNNIKNMNTNLNNILINSSNYDKQDEFPFISKKKINVNLVINEWIKNNLNDLENNFDYFEKENLCSFSCKKCKNENDIFKLFYDLETDNYYMDEAKKVIDWNLNNFCKFIIKHSINN